MSCQVFSLLLFTTSKTNFAPMQNRNPMYCGLSTSSMTPGYQVPQKSIATHCDTIQGEMGDKAMSLKKFLQCFSSEYQ